MLRGHIDFDPDLGKWWMDLDFSQAPIDTDLLRQYYELNGATYATWQDQRPIWRCFDVPPAVTQSIHAQMSSWPSDVSWAMHRTDPGTLVPIHADHYQYLMARYPDRGAQEIERFVFFVEDRQPGHIIEVHGELLPDWKAGDWVNWKGQAPHTIANLGFLPRFSLVATFMPNREEYQ